VFLFIMTCGAAALITSCFPGCLASFRPESRRVLALDSAAALAAAVGLAVALSQLRAVLAGVFHAQALFSPESPDLIVSSAPAVAALAGSLSSILAPAAGLVAVAMAIRKFSKRWALAPLALAGVLGAISADVHTPGEFALQYGLALAGFASLAFVCLWFARRNYLAYALILWVAALRAPLGQLFGAANPAFETQGWIVAGAMALVVAWAVYPAFLPVGQAPRPAFFGGRNS